MRAVSLSAYYNYKKCVPGGRNASDGLIRARLNCMVDATDRKNIHPRIGYTMYKFGNLKIYVCENIIRDIKLSTYNKNPSTKEINNLKKMYKKNGLNVKGKMIKSEGN